VQDKYIFILILCLVNMNLFIEVYGKQNFCILVLYYA